MLCTADLVVVGVGAQMVYKYVKYFVVMCLFFWDCGMVHVVFDGALLCCVCKVTCQMVLVTSRGWSPVVTQCVEECCY